MPIWLPFVAEAVKPTASYSCSRHVIVIVSLQLASTCPPEAEGTLIGGAVASMNGCWFLEKRSVDLRAFVPEKCVVGCTTSMCPCRLSGRLYAVVRTSDSPVLLFVKMWYSYLIAHQEESQTRSSVRAQIVARKLTVSSIFSAKLTGTFTVIQSFAEERVNWSS